MSDSSGRIRLHASQTLGAMAISALCLGCLAEVKPKAAGDAGANVDSPDARAADGVPLIDAPRGVDTLRSDLLIMADLSPGTGPSDASFGDGAACAMQSVVAERLPLDLYVMMDSSGSMTEDTALGVTKWDAVKAAMISFIEDPQSAGIGVGIQYFPQLRPNVPAECLADVECNGFGPCFRARTCTGTATVTTCSLNSDCARTQTCVLLGLCAVSLTTCAPTGGACASGAVGDTCTPFGGYCLGRDNCDVPPYSTPAVAIGTLPAAARALVTSIQGHELDGLTPTAPAVTGAVAYAQQHATANPGRKAAVLLVTDGFPSECVPTDIPAIADIAAAGARGTPAVPTFVIGVFAPLDAAAATLNLNALAAGGGTGSAVVINTNQNVTVVLQAALNQIRTTAVACEFRIPPPSMGVIDYAKVNVQFTGANGAATTIGYVRNRAGCDATRGGWYYDVDPATGAFPKSIISCEATCRAFRADSAGRVDIVLGCQTYVIV